MIFLLEMIFWRIIPAEFWSWGGFEICLRNVARGAQSTKKCAPPTIQLKVGQFSDFLSQTFRLYVIRQGCNLCNLYKNRSQKAKSLGQFVWQRRNMRKKSIKCHIVENLKRHFRQSAISVNICCWYKIEAFSFSIISTYFSWETTATHFYAFRLRSFDVISM